MKTGEKTMRPASKALIQRHGEVLALKALYNDSIYWTLPGGKLESGESFREALSRELKEELGCRTEVGKTIGTYTVEKEKEFVPVTAFRAEIEGEIDISGAEETVKQYHWMRPEKLAERTDNDSLEQLLQKEVIEEPKLVRDRIPEIIEDSTGEEPEVSIAEDGEYREFLLQKVLEEAREVYDSGKEEEIADLLEVLHTLTEDKGMEMEEIREITEEKKEEKGGFKQGIILDKKP